ncbi:serine/threonine-protein kinase [Streptomyces sp. NPDC058622]|uniref:serine/threonine-protein kinase n=1 Tax=Streptomyces sp. NPDC058622 TaxID=3346562 RepID=UPI0036685BB2
MEQLHPHDPHRIGPYRLLSRLGAGGMGQVYLARSDRGRTVAVKLVHPELAAREEFRIRFRQEVAAARRVGGAWTAPVLDADTEAPTPWFATGYIAGPSLRQAVAGDFGPLPGRSVRILAAGLAYALQDIHRAGLIHRDLKPSNVLLTLDGPRVIDFGIARAPAGPDAGLTRTGELIGSPGFMAPEQINGVPVTAACDVFCLGAVLAYAATGRLPFGDSERPGGMAALLLRITGAEPDLTGVPAGLHDLVRDCLRRNPAERPGPAEVLARVGAGDTVADGRALEPWLPGPLVAQLGRHAVQLLDREDAGPDRAEPEPEPTATTMPAAPAPSPYEPPYPAPYGLPYPPPRPGGNGAAPRPTPPRLPASPPPPPPPLHPSTLPTRYGAPTLPTGHPAYGPPRAEPAPRPRTASTAFLLAVAAVVAVAAGGTVYAVMGRDQGVRPPGSTPRTPGVAAPSDPAAPSPSAPATAAGASGAGTSAAAGRLPDAYLGTWRATNGTQTWQLTLGPGSVGDTVMSLSVRDPAFACSWEAPLRSASEPVELDGSTVTSGDPVTCAPGGWSRLRLLPGGGLQRELVGSDTPPLTYREQ